MKQIMIRRKHELQKSIELTTAKLECMEPGSNEHTQTANVLLALIKTRDEGKVRAKDVGQWGMSLASIITVLYFERFNPIGSKIFNSVTKFIKF